MKGVSILVYICLLLAAVLWHLVTFSGFFHISQLPSLIWFGFLANVCMSSLPTLQCFKNRGDIHNFPAALGSWRKICKWAGQRDDP